MYKTSIQRPDQRLAVSLTNKINNKTKPLGALGQLEVLALQAGLVQSSLEPSLQRPVMMVFAGDHGIVKAGVTPYPQEVTMQMVLNFLNGGAGINVFTRQHGMQVRVIDAGVNADLSAHPDLINAKVAKGTRNFLQEPAMTLAECEQALNQGVALAQAEVAQGTNVLGFGEMGIGNTSAAAAIMAVLCNLTASECVGRGTGLDDAGLQKKTTIIQQALDYHALDGNDVLQVLATFGGFEIAMMAGAMLGAAQQKALLLVDGFIATAALLVASRMQPAIIEYCVFSHCSDESGHRIMLQHLNATPLLNLGLRLGEGTGAALAYPLLQAAVNFLNQMASFESANVSRETT